jgi:hypothetical protein
VDLAASLKKNFTRIRPASGWKDKEAPLTAARVPSVSGPSWEVIRGGIGSYRFDAGSEESVYITFHLPHDMALSYTTEDGTVTDPKLYPHVHYLSNEATPDGTNAVRWGFEWSYANGYGTDTFGATTTTEIDHIPGGVQYQHEIAEVSDANAITGNFEVDGIIIMRFYRDGVTDSNTSDWFVPTVDIHYLSDGLETQERNRGTGDVPWHKQNPL